MDQSMRRTAMIAWGGLGLVIVGIVAAFVASQVRQDGTPSGPLPVYGQVADFSLTNQDGASVSLPALRGKVWIADVIFTRCPGPCSKMTREMGELQEASRVRPPVQFVSLTSDPGFDTPAVLKAYSERFGADSNRWTFLTGTKGEIVKLAVDSLKLVALDKKPEEREAPNDLFIHSTTFVIVDKRGQLRGVFETMGEGVDFSQTKKKLLSAAKQLEREP
jgi:protein SCO1/2